MLIDEVVMSDIKDSTTEKKLGKYTIVSQLGQGAMGTVYKGFDPLIERYVAIKTIRKKFLEGQDIDVKQILARFKREAQAAGRLNHPNIVSVYEYGEDNNTVFIAMEIVNGRELKEFFDKQERFVDEDHVFEIMYQLLNALAHSHKHGVVHRDIKPANIIVMDDGQIKVADFGIANVESSNLTQVGSMLGTPGYMSPEQIMGQKVDAYSDIFSAGIVFYQLLTGEKPFPGQAMATIMHKVLNEIPANPSILNCQIPSALDDVIQKALAKKTKDRFQTANEFSNAIKKALKNETAVTSNIESKKITIASTGNLSNEAPNEVNSEEATVLSTNRPASTSFNEEATVLSTNNRPANTSFNEEATVLSTNRPANTGFNEEATVLSTNRPTNTAFNEDATVVSNPNVIQRDINLEQSKQITKASSSSKKNILIAIILIIVCSGAGVFFFMQTKQKEVLSLKNPITESIKITTENNITSKKISPHKNIITDTNTIKKESKQDIHANINKIGQKNKVTNFDENKPDENKPDENEFNIEKVSDKSKQDTKVTTVNTTTIQGKIEQNIKVLDTDVKKPSDQIKQDIKITNTKKIPDKQVIKVANTDIKKISNKKDNTKKAISENTTETQNVNSFLEELNKMAEE